MDINVFKHKMYDYGEKINLTEQSKKYPIIAKSAHVFPEGASIYADDTWHYIVMERGQEQEHHSSEDLEEILYYVFETITSSLAEKYAMKNRVKGKDFRRLFFEKQLELLGIIDKGYQKKLEEELILVLERAPYKDL